eukprot:1685048-Lingulodinium_polyedra.AAC.1
MAVDANACARASGTTSRCAVGSRSCHAEASSHASGSWWRSRGATRETPVTKKRYLYMASPRSYSSAPKPRT